MMDILEHKDEKFIIKARFPARSLVGVSLSKIRRNHRADIVIRHGDEYLALEYIIPVNFEDIQDDNDKDKNQIPAESTSEVQG